MTVYIHEGKIGVCSRNWDLDDTEDNLYWKVFHKCEMNRISCSPIHNIALQGELVGPGVNHNRAKLTEHDFYLFDIYLIDERRYMTPQERLYFFKYICDDCGMNIKHVPIIACYSEMLDKENALKFAEHLFNNEEAEGIVLKSTTSGFSYKAISNKYLLDNDE